MAHAKHENLWAVTTGQRVRYSGAIVTMAVANICMFAAPLIAKYAIDVVVAKDVSLGTPMLVAPAQWLEHTFASQNAFAWYLLLSALLAVAVTALGGLVGADAFCRFDAVELRHLDVHQHEIIGRAGR